MINNRKSPIVDKEIEEYLAPKSNHVVPPFYIYRKETLTLIRSFIEEGNYGDAPGMLISWLLKIVPIYGYFFKGNRYDIGTLDSYESAQKVFVEKETL